MPKIADSFPNRFAAWIRSLTGNPAGRRQLAVASFLESSVVPIPLETIVVPLMVADSRQAFRVAAAIWVGSVAAALSFYFLAALLFDSLLLPGLEALGLADDFAETKQRLDRPDAFWTIFIISVTPAPLQLATLGAGSLGTNLLVFVAAIALSRGIRYFGLALAARIIGPRIARMLDGKMMLVVGAVLVLLGLYTITLLIF